MGGIFISYRRDDSASAPGRLCDHLHAAGFQLFRDIDDIPPGRDFRVVIRDALQQAEVVLVVIGNRWLDANDDRGARRLDSASDTHRVEVTAALHSDALVIPVLVEGARPPAVEDLPADLADLAFKNAWELTDRRFGDDVDRLALHIRAAQHDVETDRETVRLSEAQRREAEQRAADEVARQQAERAAREQATAAREVLESEARLRKENAAARYYSERATTWRPQNWLEWAGWAIATVIPALLIFTLIAGLYELVFGTTNPDSMFQTWGDAIAGGLGLLLFSAPFVALGAWLIRRGRRRRGGVATGPEEALLGQPLPPPLV